MITIKVLGSGCENCQRVEAVAREAIEQMEIKAEILHVRDHAAIHAYPILATPGLVINEKLVCGGHIPTLDEVKTWIKQADETK
jgi:small redox-active disulfide protein 2